MPTDWDIRPRSDTCSSCEKAFEDRAACFSRLVFAEEGYTRADYCAECWAGQRAEPGSEPHSVWHGVYRAPPPPSEDPLKKETAETLLRHLMARDDPSMENVIYVLAVMLERKKLLVEKDVQTRDDGTMIRVYEYRKSGETFLIPDPRLRLDQLEPVQRQVVAMLG
ncbi:hypothetical protein ACFLSJ_06425 [Verrucomicrobiota bacterium]